MAWEHGRVRFFNKKTSAPTVNDDENDGYRESDVWVDETNNKAYMCLDASAGSADWNQIDAGAGAGSGTVTSVKEAGVLVDDEVEVIDLDGDHFNTTEDPAHEINITLANPFTEAHITAIEANTAHTSSDGSDHTFIDQDVTIGASPTLDGANITNIDADTLIADVKEANVSAVKKGQACAIVDSSGSKFEVQLADCSNVNLLKLLGLSDADVTQNEEGTVVHKGRLTIVDTQTTNTDVNPNAETWAAGDLLYVSTTPGGLTNVQPAGRCIIVGYTLKGNSASDTILVVTQTDIICTCAAPGEDICHVMGDSAGTNKVTFKDYADVEVAAIDSTGNLTLRGIEAVDIGKDTKIEVTAYSNGTFKLIDAPIFNYRKAYGSKDSPEEVVDGALLGTHNFFGYQSGGFRIGAQLICQVDGAPSDTYVPGELRFITYDNENNNYALVMRSNGAVGVGTTTPGGKLCVNGGVTVGSDTDAGDNNLRVEGNVVVAGTVDGRDIAADGTKLDGAAPRHIQIRLLDKDTSHSVEDGIGGDFRLKIAMTVLDVGMYFDTAGTDSVTTMQIKEGGVNILSTAITVDATEKTSETAATPSVISDSAIAADGIITFNLSGIASGTAGKGLVVWLEATTP